MGTNYYLRAQACPCCGLTPPEYHLGKSSMGWAFGFHGNRDPELGAVITTAKEWQAHAERLIAEGWELQNEYGDPLSLNALLNLIERKRDGLNHTTYGRERYPEHADRSYWLDADGNSFTEGEFS